LHRRCCGLAGSAEKRDCVGDIFKRADPADGNLREQRQHHRFDSLDGNPSWTSSIKGDEGQQNLLYVMSGAFEEESDASDSRLHERPAEKLKRLFRAVH
jgi:hypothetical protein